MKKFVVSKVSEVIVLLDGSKFNQSGLASYAGVEQISKIITDSSAPADQVEKFRKAGTEVLMADLKQE